MTFTNEALENRGGFRVEHLKFQDSTTQQPFTVEVKITTRDKPWHWETASFTKIDHRQANASEAVPYVRELLCQRPGLCSTEIRDELNGTPGLTPSGISDALKYLHETGETEWKKAGRRKEWNLV